ncbi:MAG: hypothetical protein ACN0LA_05150 [Candidatus Longimicrobiales bacterium M2_2A_002]
MELFEFIIILVLISTIGKVLIEVGGPLASKLGDLARELAASRKADREELTATLETDVVEELERRLARIEDRLDFLEELKAPDPTRALGGGRGLDRGAGRPDATDREQAPPGSDSTRTDEDTAGEP